MRGYGDIRSRRSLSSISTAKWFRKMYHTLVRQQNIGTGAEARSRPIYRYHRTRLGPTGIRKSLVILSLASWLGTKNNAAVILCKGHARVVIR